MGTYRRVCDSRHVQADCRGPGSAPKPKHIQNNMSALKRALSPIFRDTADETCCLPRWRQSVAVIYTFGSFVKLYHTHLFVFVGHKTFCESVLRRTRMLWRRGGGRQLAS